MEIKAPAVYDISHWKEVLDFNAISPRPFLMITKATESNWLKDSKFIRFFDGMKQAGYKRGCYHFFRKRIDARAQALFFCNFIEPYIDGETILILDVEEGGETAEQLKTWFDVVRGIFPRHRLLLYSARRILDPIPMTTAEREYFKTIPVWTAGYPYFPDVFHTVPPAYIPDPSKYGPVVLWQYSEVGQVAGIEGDVDLNWISPTYQQLLGGASVPQEEEETMAYRYEATSAFSMALRPFPGVDNSPIQYIPAQSKMMGNRIEGAPGSGRCWLEVLAVNNMTFSTTGWVAVEHAGRVYSALTDTQPPTPEPTPAHVVEVFIDGVSVYRTELA
jgi:lysozyme